MERLVVSCATRARPGRIVDYLNIVLRNIERDNTHVMVGVDEDDIPTRQILQAFMAGGPPRADQLTISIKPREDTIAEKWNRALEIPGDVYVISSEDAPDITPAFDSKILNAAKLFPDGIGVVYGHMANASFPGVMAPTRRWAELLGWLFPPYFPYWFVDHWVDDLAKITERIAFADVRTDQSNPGKTMEMREPGWWATWFDASYYLRDCQAAIITSAPDFHAMPNHLQRLMGKTQLIHTWSRHINQGVRQQSAALSGWSGLGLDDPRYQRVKQRAIDMLPGLLAHIPEGEAAIFREMLLGPAAKIG